MGGGNGLKSFMSKERNAKAGTDNKGGGGAAGIKARTESKCGVQCALCKTPFTSVKMVAQLRDHVEARHPRSSLAEAFPGVTI
jgi:hypothetical protein